MSKSPSRARKADLESLCDWRSSHLLQLLSERCSLKFIDIRWADLTRNNYGILDLCIDPKWPLREGEKWILYVKGEDPVEIERKLRAMNPGADMDQIEVKELPPNAVSLSRQGALYLPYPYIVPGGRFQELYAWDTFFGFIGLILDGKTRLAHNVVDDHLYEVEHYGAVLNGNRSYYTTRSQLPFLGEMVLRTYAFNDDRAWLARAVELCERFHAYYTSGGHNVEGTGLQRFFDFGRPGSAPPEADMHEKDKDGRTPHERVKEYYREHYKEGIEDYTKLPFDHTPVITDRNADIADMYDYDKDELTAKYFDSDRAMRESGFDTSGRFGKFGANCLAYLPVCLNSLLYLLERNISEIHSILDRHRFADSDLHATRADRWAEVAEKRKEAFMRHCWDEEDGLFYDYDHEKGRRRRYVFGTTFLPLWTGMASQEQARRIVKTAMEKLSYPGGLSTSDRSLDTQWDCPFGWAPLQLFAVEGMRRYGFKQEASRIAVNFASCVLKCFLDTGEVWEKYDVLRRSEKVRLLFGYDTNETGFAWTGGVCAPVLPMPRLTLRSAIFTGFIQSFDAGERSQVLHLDGIGAHAEDSDTVIV